MIDRNTWMNISWKFMNSPQCMNDFNCIVHYFTVNSKMRCVIQRKKDVVSNEQLRKNVQLIRNGNWDLILVSFSFGLLLLLFYINLCDQCVFDYEWFTRTLVRATRMCVCVSVLCLHFTRIKRFQSLCIQATQSFVGELNTNVMWCEWFWCDASVIEWIEPSIACPLLISIL